MVLQSPVFGAILEGNKCSRFDLRIVLGFWAEGLGVGLRGNGCFGLHGFVALLVAPQTLENTLHARIVSR